MNILDSRFKYVPAAKTDLKKTFARIRKQNAERQGDSRPCGDKLVGATASAASAPIQFKRRTA